ncbi:MAG: protein kinase [Myxococcales bacterium]|nr:protein kinase [Myxococcota bacterium]MDW8280763.1 protein kinase [Myxococcales bacterium]
MSSTDTPLPPLPTRLGRYQIVERLARGGMAEIFRAKMVGEHGFEKNVVVKRVLPHLASDPEFVDMLIDEARLSARLIHPKIVQVFEFGQDGGQYFIAMEYVDGLDCLALLRACAQRRMRLPLPLSCFIAAEILDALDFAHTATDDHGAPLGLVHRDVSPSNVFISRRGDVKLGDFGIARAMDRQRHAETRAGTLKGKYGYMAPEQVVGSPLDHRADIFSAGIVLAEMLMGRRLFVAPVDLDVLLMVRDARLDRLERYGRDIPPPLRALVERALRREPDERFQTAGEFRDALLDYLYDQRVRVGPRELGNFIAQLRASELAPLSGAPLPPGGGLDGPVTQAQREAAEARKEALVRASREPAVVREAALIAASVSNRPPQATAEGRPSPGRSSPITLPMAQVSARPLGAAHLVGDFAETSPARILCRLAADRETGLLSVECGDVIKDIFLVDGSPEYVASNVAAERFGEYLVQCGAITPGELAMALAVLPRFHGRLGDTLVGLNLMRPLDVFRLLLRQVREKLIQVFSWTEGTFRFYRGRQNRREAFPLGLDAFAIIGAGVAQLPLAQVEQHLQRHAQRRVRRLERERPRPDMFRVGKGPQELWQRLDGQRTVGAWMRRYADVQDQYDTLCHTLYLLIETELAVLE